PKPAKTPTKTPTRAPTPKPPVAKTPTPTPRPNQTPTPSNPDATMTGLVLNGDFEALDNGKPAYWAKYGGEMGSTADSYGGKWSATLSSTTSSTKWLNQVVAVDAGAWYRLTAVARAENATAFVRISWYASADGSGSQLDSVDGSETTASDWTALDTGSVQAPDDAESARVKLMLRPASGSGRALFDDVWLVPSEAGAATPSPTATARAATATKTGSAPTHTATPRTGTRSTQTAAAGQRPRSGATTRATAAPLSANGALTGPSPLRLSEFMSDPPKAGNDGSDEWVEITNVSGTTVSTAGWRISDAKTADDIPEASIAPGEYLVIAGKSADTGSATGVVRIADGVIGNGLSNGGDAIALLAPSGEVADAISYGSNTDIFEPPPAAPDTGRSLGTRDPAAEQAAENWDITLAPSPGQPNTFARSSTANSTATSETGSLDQPVDDPQARSLTANSAHDVPTLDTLDWALIAGILACVSVVAGVFGRRYFVAAWNRVRRGH
ncbi:MAG TPA: lamin tail domain-containing protein, partial [Tepidiformaceae bacterium]|nr:lamin tail domain-containing protein [Tepidiformaceae bacterium]